MANNLTDRFRKGNLLLRTISAIVLIPLVLFIVNYGGVLYSLSITALSVLMVMEWKAMVMGAALSKKPRLIWLICGWIYMLIPCLLMVDIRLNASFGMDVMLWILLCVWATDIGAYFAGISIGGPKIAPKISPSKTWAGLGGAIMFSGLVGFIYARLAPDADFPYFGASLILPAIAQAGDFLESAVKRHFKVKDSGSLIPGHGGILDRVDGLITAVIFTWIIMMVR